MRYIAVILAGGTGSRVGGKTPKQLLPLADGRSVLEHAIDAFEQAPSIDEIAVVMHPDYIGEVQRLCLQNSWQKVQQIIPGGAERWQSSWQAIQAFRNQPSEVSLLIHDAARPFVSLRIIEDTCEALKTHPAVTVAIPVTDTLYKVESGKLKVESIPNRADFMRAQTPQSFHLSLLAEAYERALAAPSVEATDDCGVVHKYMPEQPIYIVAGEETNRKITYKEDL